MKGADTTATKYPCVLKYIIYYWALRMQINNNKMLRATDSRKAATKNLIIREKTI